MRRLRLAVVWLVTLGLLAFLFARVPLGQVLEKATLAAPWTFGVGFVALIAVFLADALATWSTFGRLSGPLPLGGLLAARGASYLLAAINYAVGQGALAFFVTRSTSLPPRRVASIVVLIALTNIFVLLVMASVGIGLGAAVPSGVKVILAIAGVGCVAYVGLVVASPALLSKYALFDTLFAAGVRGHLWAVLVRIPHVLALAAYSYTMLRGFGVAVPLSEALVGLPIVYVVAFLPISVQGLGTAQATMVLLFASFAVGTPVEQEATVLASSLSAAVFMMLFQGILGVLCLQTSVGRSLRTAPGDA